MRPDTRVMATTLPKGCTAAAWLTVMSPCACVMLEEGTVRGTGFFT